MHIRISTDIAAGCLALQMSWAPRALPDTRLENGGFLCAGLTAMPRALVLNVLILVLHTPYRVKFTKHFEQCPYIMHRPPVRRHLVDNEVCPRSSIRSHSASATISCGVICQGLGTIISHSSCSSIL